MPRSMRPRCERCAFGKKRRTQATFTVVYDSLLVQERHLCDQHTKAFEKEMGYRVKKFSV